MSESGDDNPFAVRESDGSFARAALVLARKELAVFPCKVDKSPYTDHGHHDATKEPDVIRGWDLRWPEENIRVACEMSGLVVVDEDVSGAFHEYLRAHGLTAECIVKAKTPSGGMHFYFKAREKATYPGKLCDGVDVKYHGYVIVPPSKCYSKRAGCASPREIAKLAGTE